MTMICLENFQRSRLICEFQFHFMVMRIQKIAWDTLGVGHPIDMSRDYVYCIWVFTELSINIFQNSTCWQNNRQNCGNVQNMSKWMEWKNSYPLYQKYAPTAILYIHKPKSAAQYRRHKVAIGHVTYAAPLYACCQDIHHLFSIPMLVIVSLGHSNYRRRLPTLNRVTLIMVPIINPWKEHWHRHYE